jgi:uncharacterized protein, PH0010 family
MITTEERHALISIARNFIEAALEGKRMEIDEASLPESILAPSGAFVTLRIGGDLRGCIGSIYAAAPLYRSVAENAYNAAFRDPRFRPLTRQEYPLVSLEISVMHPVEPVTDLESIVVGRDGLIVRKGHFGGLLLPQVATEYGWDRDTFLSQTCAKAGLPRDEWRKGDCSIEKFSAEVFSEDEETQAT